MPPANYKVTLYALSALALSLLGLEAALRLAGFEFHAPPFRPPPPPCLVQGTCAGAGSGLFEKKGELVSLRPEYTGWFQDQSFPARKPAGEFRTFIFGGSSIYNLYGQMENSYDEAGMKVRVVNIGGNSFGTRRLLPVFEDILAYEPDLLLIYSGHNEFVDIEIADHFIETGPFRKKLTELLQPWRVCGLVEMAVYKAGMALMKTKKRHDNGVVRYFGTRMRLGTDKEKIYARYGEYLAAMAREAAKRGVPLELCTVGYNRTIRPAGPGTAAGLYEKGMALLRSGSYAEARAALARAQDAEPVPYGANETTNRIVRETAARYKVPLVDIDGAVAAHAPNGIPGGETYYDQCHFIDSHFLAWLFRKEISAAIAARKKKKA